MESGKIIVVANQKGGVAKTSTVRNLSYALAEMGKKVLVVDFDPQYNLTTSFGVLPTQAPYNTGTLITNLLLDESLPDTNEFIQKIGSVDLIPSSRSLTVAEANLLMTPDSNDYLATLLNPLRLSYDYIIVDTNPSLGSLTINALTAADEVIIPIDPELFALTGLQALVDTIKKIKRKLNPSIEIGGILFTKCNKRTNLYEYLVNKMAAIRWRGSDLDASYHAALFLMASHPALFQKMDRYLCPEGIDFTKMMRKEEFEYDWMKITADAARNLFSWNSKCAATPFEISRMPAPAIRALFTACFIANGDYMVSVRKNDKGEKVFEIDDSAGKRREAFNLQMEQMMEAPGMEPD